MNDLVFLILIGRFEVRNIERPHALQQDAECLVRLTLIVWSAQLLAHPPQDAENPCPIESLAFAMVTVAHCCVFARDKWRKESFGQ